MFTSVTILGTCGRLNRLANYVTKLDPNCYLKF